MEKIKVAINGFGRIGRTVCRVMLTMPTIEIVAINDRADSRTLAHLFKYDSVHRTYQGNVESGTNFLSIDGNKIRMFAEAAPVEVGIMESAAALALLRSL